MVGYKVGQKVLLLDGTLLNKDRELSKETIAQVQRVAPIPMVLISSRMPKGMRHLQKEFKNEKNLNDCKIFGPRNDSQDTWIFHSKFLPSDKQIIRTNFLLGKAGCDNAIAYLFNDFGFIVFNEPYVIRTYHYHLSQIRNYTAIDKINPPYLLIKPIERSDLQIRS